jgi:hypothetical protein
MPEWKATIDGKPVAIQPSQGLTKSIFQQVTVPAGTHKVVFHYDPPFGVLSVVVALLSWVLIIGLLISTSSARRVLGQRFGRRGVEPAEVPEEAETSVAIQAEASPEGDEDAQTGDELADR